MNTRNSRNAVPEGQFPWLENIQPIGPGNLHSIPGRGLALTFNPTPPNACPDENPAAQELPVVCCYLTDGFGDLSDNCAGSMIHVEADGSFWATASEMSGFPSGPYPTASPTQTWYLLAGDANSCDVTDATGDAVDIPGNTANFQSTQTPQTGASGKSDEKSYRIVLSSISPGYVGADIQNGPGYIGAGSSVTTGAGYFGEQSGFALHFELDNSTFLRYAWCAFDTHLYGFVSDAFFNLLYLASWPKSQISYEDNRTAIVNAVPDYLAQGIGLASTLALRATQNFLYLLVVTATSPVLFKIYKMNRSTLQYVADYTLDLSSIGGNPIGMEAVTDDFFYINVDYLPTPSWGFGWWRISTAANPVFKIGEVGRQCVANAFDFAHDQSTFIHRAGYFYMAYSGGTGIGDPNVLKVGPVTCPSNPSIIFDPSGET